MCLIFQTKVDYPLSVVPKRVRLWAPADAFKQNSQFCVNHFQSFARRHSLKHFGDDLTPVIPQCVEVWAQIREFLGLGKRLLGVVPFGALLQNLLVDQHNFVELLFILAYFVLSGRLVCLFFPTVKHLN